MCVFYTHFFLVLGSLLIDRERICDRLIIDKFCGKSAKKLAKEIDYESKNRIMLQEPVSRTILKMAFPTIVAFLITSVYNFADTYFVSSLGTSATAAVSVNASLDQIIMMAGSMLAIGANSYIARLHGQQNREKASQVLSTAFFIALAIGLLIMVLGLIFTKPLVHLLGATTDCEKYSMDYAKYLLLVAPFMATNFVMNQCLRAEGSAILSMIGLGFGGILNCILDPIFIFNLDLEVAGASIATAISKLVSFGILIVPYLMKKCVLTLSVKNFRFNKDIVGEIVKMGSSSLFRTGLAIVAAILLNNLAGEISDSVLAGIGVTTKVMMFPMFAVIGFCNGVQPVAGYNWGAKRYDRVLQCWKFGWKVSVAASAILAGTIAIFAEPLISIFTETDAEMMRVGALCLRMQCIAFPVVGGVAMVYFLCSGLGKAKQALLLSTSRQGTCFIPFLYPLAIFFKEAGLAAVQGVADFLSFFIALPIQRRIISELKTLQKAGIIEDS